MFLRLFAAAVLAANLIAEQPAGFKNPQAQEHYRRALEYGGKGLWAPEIVELRHALDLEPQNQDVLAELGIAHGERKEWEDALKYLRRAVAAAPQSARAHYNLALTLDRASPGKGAGIAEYRKALQLDPKHVDSLMNLGVDIGDRNAAEAKPLFERAIRAAPGNAKVHLNFGLLLKRQAEEDASISEFQAAIRSDPGLLEARRQLLALRMARREWSQAIEECREIVKREPSDAATRYSLAQALMRDQKQEEGKKELAEAQALRKRAQEVQEAQALQNEGERFLRIGKFQDAIKPLRSALALDPSAANRMYLGVALAGSGDVAAGVAELKVSIEQEPGSARAHLNLGSVYLQTGQPAQARIEFEQALQFDPWLSEAHNNLGMILAGSQQFAEAVGHFRLAVDLEPKYPDAYFNLGLALRNLNLVPDALKAFRRAAELAPNNPQAQYALGMTLKDMGDSANARVALDRAAALDRRFSR